MASSADIEAEEAVDLGVSPAINQLLHRLTRAINLSGVGGSRRWPLEKRATHALRVTGIGGRVSESNPMTIRRAITLLENYKVS